MIDDKNWLTIPQSLENGGLKKAVSIFGSKVVAVNRQEAYKSGAIVKPTNYHKNTVRFDVFYTPVCPSGFKAISTFSYFY